MRFAILLNLGLLYGQSWYQVRTLAGAGGIGDGGPASAALFLNITGVAVDPTGNVYLSDTDTHRIRKISPSGQTSTFAGTGRAGFGGDGGPASQALLNYPYGIATDYGGSVYVADLGNARVRKITPDGIIATIAGNTPETKLIAPRNVAVDGPGNLVISDFGAHKVLRLGRAGLIPVAGAGRAGNAGDNGPATAALLTAPAGLAFDPAGNLYIGDTGNKRVRKVTMSTGVITSVPDTQLLPIVATGLAFTFLGELWVPDGNGGTLMRLPPQQQATPFPFAAMDVAADFAGNVFAVRGNLARRINSRTSAVSAFAGGNPFYLAGDGGKAYDSRLQKPGGLTVDPATGTLYIADSRNGRIRRITTAGVIETVLDGFSNPQGIFWDRQQQALFVADAGSNSVWIWRAGAVAQTVIAGGAGKSGFSGDGGTALDAQLNAPAGVAVDDRGNVWISDSGNDRIRLINSQDGRIRTVAQMKAPAGIVWDSRGFLYAAEPSTGRVHRVYASSGVTDPISNPGIWLEPRGVALDFDGSLLVADSGANRLSRMTSDGAVAVLAGTGEAGFDGDAPAAAVGSRFDGISAVAADSSNLRLVVADANNNRIRVLELGEQQVSVNEVPTASATVTLLNAASRAVATAVAPGGLFAITAGAALTPDASEVAFDGLVTPALAVAGAAGGWIVQAPETLVNPEAELTISRGGIVQIRQFVKVAAAAPGVFPSLINADDGTVNSADSPVARGRTISFRMTGEGRAGLPVTVRIRDTDAAVIAQEGEPDSPGVIRVDVQVPGGYFPAGAFPLTVMVGEFSAQAGMVVFVR